MWYRLKCSPAVKSKGEPWPDFALAHDGGMRAAAAGHAIRELEVYPALVLVLWTWARWLRAPCRDGSA